MKRSCKETIALNTLGILLLCHWGNKEETTNSIAGGGKKPEVNFHGTILDNTGTTVKANYLTVSGMYRQIPVYLEPKDLNHKDYNPADNIARLDLSEISKISIEDPEKIYTFLNRTYLKIHVLSNDNTTTNKYIIETSKKVYFDEVNESGPIEREVALTALKEMNIKGYNQGTTTQNQKTKTGVACNSSQTSEDAIQKIAAQKDNTLVLTINKALIVDQNQLTGSAPQ